MSLLTICQAVVQECGFPNLLQIVGNTDETARRLLGFCNRSGKSLQKKVDWTQLRVEYTFSTANGTAAYALPTDFDRFIPTTMWDRTNFWALEGPLTPQEWQYVKSGLVQNGPRSRFRLLPSASVDQFNVDPVPGNIRTLVFEYISKNWCLSSGGTGQSSFAADTDTAVGILDHLLALDVIWRFKESIGMAYAEQRDEFENELDMARGRDGGNRILRLNQRYPLLANIPETGFGQ